LINPQEPPKKISSLLSSEVVGRLKMTPQDRGGNPECHGKKFPPSKVNFRFLTRSFVSSRRFLDRGLSVVPTKEWQDSLSNRLASSASGSRLPSFDISGVSLTQRRRLNDSANAVPAQPDWNEMYTLEGSGACVTTLRGTSLIPTSEQEEILQKECIEGLGALSLDEHQEVQPGLRVFSSTQFSFL
jgi:hypothetical protein